MHPSNDAVNDIWHTNVEAARQYGELVLESAERLFRLQADTLRDICDLSANEYVFFWSGNSGKPLEHLPELLAKRLDFAAEMGRQCQDNALRLQADFYRVTESQMPVINRRLQKALDAVLVPA
jgi:hypothetical protein